MNLRRLIGTAAALILGATAAPGSAFGATYALDLSGPSAASVGQPVALQLSGLRPPPDQYWYEAWITLVSIPASVMPACPAGAQDADQVAAAAYASGGKIIDIALSPYSDAEGNFSNTAAYVPLVPGRILLC